MISHKHKFVFLRLPKTAGRSVSAQIRSFCEIPEGPKSRVFYTKDKLSGWHSKHWSYNEILYHKPELKDFFWFCFVRNPWDLVASYYTQKFRKNKRGMPKASKLRKFPNYFSHELIQESKKRNGEESINTKEPHLIGRNSILCQQLSYLTSDGSPNKDNICVDFIGRYENLKLDFAKVIEKVGITPDLKIKNRTGETSNKPKYSTFYTQKLIDIVAENFKEDIEFFNYEYVERQ